MSSPSSAEMAGNVSDVGAMLRKKHQFLVHAAVLLHQYGTPSHRLERVMTKVAKTLGVEGVFLYTPTALVVSLVDDAGEQTYMRRIDSGAVDVDKLLRFDEVLERLEDNQIDIDTAAKLLTDVAASAAPYHWLVTAVACGLSCGAVGIFFRGSLVEVWLATFIGLSIAVLEQIHARLRGERGMLEPLAGFAAAMTSLVIAHWVCPHDDRLVTLAGLIVLLPGLTATVAMTELAVGHLSAGVARLAGAAVTLLTLTVGVALAWRIGGGLRSLPETAAALPEVWQWLGLVLAPITFAIIFRARPRQWPVISAVSILGFLVARGAGSQWGVEVGSFLGAVAVGCGSNLYARLRDRPALIPLTPGLIMLVPGSIGYRSLTAMLDRQTLHGVDLAFSMILLAVSLVGGILTANVILPPKRIL